MRRLPRPVRFALVGTLGFAVDAGVLTALVAGGAPIMPARLASFTVAVLVTYPLNARLTFQAAAGDARPRRLLFYALLQVAGAAVNLAVFWLLLRSWPALAAQPWMPLAVASLAAMGLTYTLSRRLFARRGTDPVSEG